MEDKFSAELRKSIAYSLPEGERREDMLLCAGTSNMAKLAELPDETPLGVRYDGVSFSRDVRTFVPLPSLEEVPVRETVRTDLPASFFYDGALRSRRRFSFSGTQEKFTARLIVRNAVPTLENVDEANEIGNVIVKPWSGSCRSCPRWGSKPLSQGFWRQTTEDDISSSSGSTSQATQEPTGACASGSSPS